MEKPIDIDFFATLAKRIAVKNYSRQSVEAGIEVLEFARQLFPSPEDQRKFNWEVAHLQTQNADFKELQRIFHTERMNSSPWGSYCIQYQKPIWDGIPEQGKTILMVGEGGFGDEITASKFSYNFKQKGMNVIFATNYKSLKSSLERIPSIDDVILIEDIQTFDDYDYWVPAVECPLALNMEQEDVPKHQYLFAPEQYLTKWKYIIPESDKLKVGIRWSGNKDYGSPANIAVPFDYFDELTSVPNVEIYSLQRDDGVEDIPPTSKIIPLHNQLQTWEDTFAAISQLDLVISGSTCIPIISAGLNKETWAVLHLWRFTQWMGTETKTFLFGDNVTCYRQSKVDSWREPFERMKVDLYDRAAQKKLNCS